MTAERFISYELDKAACSQLKEDFEKRSVFVVSVNVEAYIGDSSLEEEVDEAVFVEEEIYDILDRTITEIPVPSGFLLVGLGDIGTAANPTYGIIDVKGVDWQPL